VRSIRSRLLIVCSLKMPTANPALTDASSAPTLYGCSRTDDTSLRWTKRRVAGALVDLMTSLGHSRFAVVGHDRGARAGYRLALDHAESVTAFASLTVAPTLDVFEAVDESFAMAVCIGLILQPITQRRLEECRVRYRFTDFWLSAGCSL
jgi:pimeloyl-ACP methyl ester carboxylesterase